MVTTQEILAALGIDNAGEAVQKTVLRDVIFVIEQRFLEIVEAVYSEQGVDLATMPRDDIEAMSHWIAKHIPDAEELYGAIARDYVDEIKGQLAGSVH